MKLIILIATLAFGIWYGLQQGWLGEKNTTAVAVENLPATVQTIAEREYRGVRSEDLNSLKNSMSSVDSKPERDYLIRLISLGILAKNPSAFAAFRKEIQERYPNESSFEFMKRDFPQPCSSCNGRGELSCRNCKGSGKCTNVKCQDGKISYDGINEQVSKDCPSCNGSTHCRGCKGRGGTGSLCNSCQGVGLSGPISENAELLYRASLRQLK
jgi:hypothetical protein